MKKRTLARQLALQFLYQFDLRGREVLEFLPEFLVESQTERSVREYVQVLVNGCLEHWEALDQAISSVARNWDLSRMAVVDRNILRIAAYELLFSNEVPPKVAINEAIEMGKRFSTQHSGAFINGILDKLRVVKENQQAAKSPKRMEPLSR